MSPRRIIIFILVLIFIYPALSAEAGTILSSYKYAWSNNVGYINFENVIVYSNALSGYAWSANSGWIKFNPDKGGVYNDGNGNLSGFAWGEGLGWIDFSQVKIDSNGRFTGQATGDGVGIINFDCANYCNVRTDWDASTTGSDGIIVPTGNQGNGSSGGTSQILPIISNTQDNSDSNTIIVEDGYSGEISREIDSGTVSIKIESGSIDSETKFIVKESALNNYNEHLLSSGVNLVNDAFYDIYAIDEGGNYIHSFSKPITITLPISKENTNLINPRLYWLNEINKKWALIPDAIFKADKVVFSVNHLTRFAIFSGKIDPNNLIDSNRNNKVDENYSILIEGGGDEGIINPDNSEDTISNLDFDNTNNKYKYVYISIAILILLLLSLKIYRKS